MNAKELRKLRDEGKEFPQSMQYILYELAAQIAEQNAFNRYMHLPMGKEEREKTLEEFRNSHEEVYAYRYPGIAKG
jgi:hypothetical protein